MISKMIAGSAVNTKILAMKRGSLSEKEYTEIMKLTSVPEVAVYLKENTRYKNILNNINTDSIHRGELEAILKRNLKDDIKSILSFSKTKVKFFIYLFNLKEELGCIKLFLRQILTKSKDLYPNESVFTARIFANLQGAANFEELAKALFNTEYYEALKPFVNNPERQNLFEIEMALDNLYNKLSIKSINTFLSKDEAKLVMHSYGIQSDLEIIMFILRAKKYYSLTSEEIYPYINMHAYRLKEKDIKALAGAKDENEVLELIKNTPYSHVFLGKAYFYEKNINKFILKTHHSLYKKNPYSIEAILFYIAFKNVEINNITTLIEGIRYGLTPEEIREHIIYNEY